jgi:hypothetical protein
MRWSCGDLSKRGGQFFDYYELGFADAFVFLNSLPKVSRGKRLFRFGIKNAKHPSRASFAQVEETERKQIGDRNG